MLKVSAKYLWLVLPALMGSLQSAGQTFTEEQLQIDSLKQVIEVSAQDSVKVKSLLAWDNLIYNSDPILDLELNERIIVICKKHTEADVGKPKNPFFWVMLGKAYNNSVQVLYAQGNYDKTLRYANAAAESYTRIGQKKGLCRSLNSVGQAYTAQGKYDEAIEKFVASAKIAKEAKDSVGEAYAVGNMGSINFLIGNFDQALEYYNHALKIQKALGDQRGAASSLNNLAGIAVIIEDYTSGLSYYEQSLDIALETEDISAEALALGNIGIIYQRQEKYPEALVMYKKSLAIREQINDQSGVGGTLNSIASVYFDMGNLAQARSYGTKSLSVLQTIENLTEIQESAKLLVEVYKAMNNSSKALEMYELYIATRDSLQSQETKDAVIRQEYQYSYDMKAIADSVKNADAQKIKEAELKAERADNERNKLRAERGELENEKQKQKSYFLFGGLALALLLAAFIFNRFRVTNKQKGIIEEQKQKVDEAYDELEEKNTEILDSINYAKRIQKAILPPAKLVKEYLQNSFILYKPKDIVAGDFYWLEPQKKLYSFCCRRLHWSRCAGRNGFGNL
jgi:tetratricopeptide (TPR) repeat protein